MSPGRSPTSAQRLDAELSVSYPWRSPAFFAVPGASVRFTQYHVDGLGPGAEEAPDRLIPTAALDTGLFLERDWRLAGREFVHTLEPRLFYLYVPFDNQSDLPLFDTGRFTFGFDQLFRNNRFSSADRVGDANQLAVALTSRILAPDGGERLRASVGQVFFRDREVTLPGQAPETENSSSIVADFAATLGAWRARGGIQWDPSPDRIERGTVELRYQPAPDRILDAAYRFVRLPEPGLNVEQTDASFRWPLGDYWSVVGRWYYSLTTNETLEVFGGASTRAAAGPSGRWPGALSIRPGARRRASSFSSFSSKGSPESARRLPSSSGGAFRATRRGFETPARSCVTRLARYPLTSGRCPDTRRLLFT